MYDVRCTRGRCTMCEGTKDEGEEHQDRLIEHIIDLHGIMVITLHEVFIIQSRASAQQHRQSEINVRTKYEGGSRCTRGRGTTYKGEEEDGSDSEEDSYPLPCIEPFAEDEQRPHERPHRSGSLDRTDNRDRQLFEREIGKDPTAEDNHRLEQCEEMSREVELRHIKGRSHHHLRREAGDEERHGEEQRREKDTERQHPENTIPAQRNLLTDIIKPQTKGRDKRIDNPHNPKNCAKVLKFLHMSKFYTIFVA